MYVEYRISHLYTNFFRNYVVLWSKSENRRSFFENYAKANNFDPNVPENWYIQTLEHILASNVRISF